MGSVDQVKEACRDMRTLRPLEHFLRDLRFGARLLVRGPGFTTVAVLSLALGIGSSSAIFSVINAIVLRPLPIADPQERSACLSLFLRSRRMCRHDERRASIR
jgi:hypothetical protein